MAFPLVAHGANQIESGSRKGYFFEGKIPEKERMKKNVPANVTRLLLRWSDGEEAALGELMPVVYDELRRMAIGHLRRERQNHTLQATALVNEVYLELIDQRQVNWRNRAHFFGAAAELMRRILVDHARAHNAAKRGGSAYKVSIGQAANVAAGKDLEVLALDEALTELAALDPQLCRLVELRYFGGLSIEETAEVIGLSPATIKRHWSSARAWLHRRITKGDGASDSDEAREKHDS
jgi:RNA polymerase sigma factor (TIGR02999 family)